MAEIGLRYPRRPVAGRRRTFTARLSVFMPHDDEALRGYDAATWAAEGPVSDPLASRFRRICVI